MLDNYSINEDGLIYQIHRNGFIYDRQYVDVRYNTYGQLNEYMSYLRLGYISGVIPTPIHSILDVGYGNGAFLNVCKRKISKCFGYEVNGYDIPDGITYVENWMDCAVDVVTFFDVLEHFDDPYVIKNLNVNYIVVSLPWCHYISDEWFHAWKHRREHEHLWFFNETNIFNFAKSTGYEIVHYCDVEDTIRETLDGLSNILTFTMKKIGVS